MNPTEPHSTKPSAAGTPDGGSALVHGRGIRVRLGFLYVTLAIFFSFVAFRLVQLQVFPNAELALLAKRQFEKQGRVVRFRQPILDRNGEELAVSMPSSSVFARPRLIRARVRTSRALAKVLGGTPERWLKRLNPKKPFVWIHRQLSAEKARDLQKKDLEGIFIEPENKRLYPNGPLAAHVLGFTDIDGNGLAGLELALDGELVDRESRPPVARDGRGTPSYIDRSHRDGAEDGRRGVYVTLDRRLQSAVEEELEQAIRETGARAAIAIAMDPRTGEVFALAQRPAFDPNSIRTAPPSVQANRAITHLFEPGSVMKPLYAAAAIEDGLLTPASSIDCGNGKLVIGKDTVREADASHKWAALTLDGVIRVSSNVGAVRVAQTLGPVRLAEWTDRFGLTERTLVGLPGEVTASPKDENYWKVPIQLATVGFGQGLATTPLQMVAAYAPFANGGYLVRPRILMREAPPSEAERPQGAKILSLRTVEQVRKMLVGVTEGNGGTGFPAAIPGIRVAGKTGTAQKYEAGAGYSGGKYYSSFIGFLPAEKPELLIGVMVDEPKTAFYSTTVAAPLFRRIAERGLQILDRTPKPPIAALEDHSTGAGAELLLKGSPQPLPRPLPDLREGGEGKWVLPDLAGVAVRDALRIVGKRLSKVRISGSGYLIEQTPPAGTTVEDSTVVKLHFSPAG